ncbi:hypothetical protein [Halomicrobium salinisoli]|uniref:hypothetical protein n=1 Tax=Halomicrobium salinisoli TaxID=2878391 RepID=UPI001CF0D524|nr:hypothetical protein [Halomicrobium salinisoli]
MSPEITSADAYLSHAGSVEFMNPSPQKLLLLPLAIFVAIVVGIPVSSARSDAALPLIAECSKGLSVFSSTPPSTGAIAAFVQCPTGVILILTIPGAIGIGLMILKI